MPSSRADGTGDGSAGGRVATANGRVAGLPRRLGRVLRDAAMEWSNDAVARLGAALAFYTVLSLAPLLVTAVSLVGLAVGEGRVQEQIVQQLREAIGPAVANTVASVLHNAASIYEPGAGLWSSLVAIGILVFSSSIALRQLKVAMNVVWDIPRRRRGGILHMVWNYVVSFGMVLAFGLVVAFAIVFQAALAAVNRGIASTVPVSVGVLNWVDGILALVVLALLLGVMYRYLPDTEVAWGDVWFGAGFTAVLFGIGQWVIGLYLAHNKLASAYGAFGPFVVVLLWIYYTAQIFLFGAEVTQTWAWHLGSRRSGA